MEQSVKVVIEKVVKVINMEHCCMGASTPVMGYSNEVVGEHMAEMIDWQLRNGIEVQKTTEKVWSMKDEEEATKGEWMHSGKGCNMNRMPLACLAGMVEAHEASFDLCSRGF